jgi:hypothetical protein
MFFYCRSYCLLNMFRAPLCPSSGFREYYTVGCHLWSLVLVSGLGHTTLSSTSYRQLENQAPKTTGGNQLYNTIELLMMGIMVPETCWASNKICNKKHLLHLVGILFPHSNNSDLLVINCSPTCFGRLYAHHQEVRLRYTAYGFLSCCSCCDAC